MDLIPVFPSGAPPSSPSHLDSGEDAGQPSTTYRPSPSAHLSSSHFNQATPMMQYPSVTSSPRGHSPHSVALNAGLSRGNSPHSGSQNSSMSQISYAANSSGHSPKHISSHSRTQNQLSYPTAAQSAHSPKHLSPRLASMMYPSSPRLSSPKSPRISKASTGETSQFSPGLGSSAPQTPEKSRHNNEAPLDLSVKSQPCQNVKDNGPLDLTVNKFKDLDLKQKVPCFNTGNPRASNKRPSNYSNTTVEEPSNDDDDVIVVGVQKGRKQPAPHHGNTSYQLHGRHLNLPASRYGNIPTPSGQSNPGGGATVFSMNKKETLSGGVAYTPFDLNNGLMRFKQMLLMAKDTQQVKHLAHTFQKMALQAFLRSRLHQQKMSAASASSTTTNLLSSSSGTSESLSNVSSRSTSSIGGISLPESTATTTSTSSENFSNFEQKQQPHMPGTSDTTSFLPTSLTTSSSESSVSSAGVGLAALGSTPPSAAQSLLGEKSPQTNLSLLSTKDVTANASGVDLVTMAAAKTGSSSSKTRSDSPASVRARNFESEYMKYVRSKRFMSGGMNVTPQRLLVPNPQKQQQQTSEGSQQTTSSPLNNQESEQQKMANIKPELATTKRSSNAAAELHRKLAKAGLSDYQYIIQEINKVTRSVAEAMLRKRYGLVEEKITPPPAHSKINLNTVDPKKPHLSMLMKGPSPWLAQKKSFFRNASATQMPNKQVSGKKLVSVIRPEEILAYQSATSLEDNLSSSPDPSLTKPKLSTDSPPPLQPLYQLNRSRTPVHPRIKTWTPPVAQVPDTSGYTPVRRSKHHQGKERSHTPAELDGAFSTTPLHIPKYPSSSGITNDDTREMLSAYSTDDGQMDELMGRQGEGDGDYSRYQARVIEIAPEEDGSTSFETLLSEGGSMSYQSNRILSGGTVSTPTVITGKNPTDLISAGGSQPSAPFPCISPNGSTVLKPVTSTFIGWKQNGFKRIPVAPVNPIKVKDTGGEGEGHFVDIGVRSGEQQSLSNPTMTGFVGQQLSNEYLQYQQRNNEGDKNDGSECLRPFTEVSQSHTMGMNQRLQAATVRYSPYNQQIQIQDGNITVKKPMSETPGYGNHNNDIPIIQGQPVVTPSGGIMSTPTTIKAQRKQEGNNSGGKSGKGKKSVVLNGDQQQEELSTKTSQKPSGKGGKNKSSTSSITASKSVETKAAAIKAILRDQMTTSIVSGTSSGVNDASAGDSANQGVNLNKNKSHRRHTSNKGVNFHSSDDEDDNKAGVFEDKQLKSEGDKKKGEKRKRKKNKDGEVIKKKKLKRDLNSDKTMERDVTSLNGQQSQEKLKVKAKKRGRKSKANRNLYAYNKNAKYEEELVREEERKLLLKVRRQARRSTTSQDDNSHDTAISKEDNEALVDVTSVDIDPQHLLPTAADPESELAPPVKKKKKMAAISGALTTKVLKKKRLDKQLTSEWTVSGANNQGELMCTADGKKLKKKRRRRWYKKRKQAVFQYLPLESEFGPLLDESLYAPIDNPDFEAAPPLLDDELQDAPYVDPELLAELKSIVVCRETGETKLHRLTRMGHEDLAVRCIEAGLFDVNSRDHAGYTALHESCVTGRLKVAKALLANGANVDAAAQDGTRPLHDAVDHCRLELVRLLLSCGADPKTSTYSGKTPMKIARMPDMKQLLTGHIQDVNGPQSGDTENYWQFSLTSEQKHYDQIGCDVFGDVPEDSTASDEEEMHFELWENPPLNCYYLYLDVDIGPRNYYLLKDVSTVKGMAEDDFKLLNFDLTYISVNKQQAQELCDEYHPTSKEKIKDIYKDEMDDGKIIEFVESNSLLLSILEIETMGVSINELNQYCNKDHPIDSETLPEKGNDLKTSISDSDAANSTDVGNGNLVPGESNSNGNGSCNSNVISTRSELTDVRNPSRSSSLDEPLPVLMKVGDNSSCQPQEVGDNTRSLLPADNDENRQRPDSGDGSSDGNKEECKTDKINSDEKSNDGMPSLTSFL